MALLNKKNIGEIMTGEFASTKGKQILLFDNYTDEFMYCEAYPEYVYDVIIETASGKMNKRWIIVEKEKVVPSIKAIKDSMADGARIQVIDFDESRFKTIRDFLDFNKNMQPQASLLKPSDIIYINFGSKDGMDICHKNQFMIESLC